MLDIYWFFDNETDFLALLFYKVSQILLFWKYYVTLWFNLLLWNLDVNI
jgi:hypothetical protein